MEFKDIAKAQARTWCVISHHREGTTPSVLFGDPLAVLGMAPGEFSEESLEAFAVFGAQAERPWRTECESSVYLVSSEAEGARWLESSSVRAPDGGLLVSMRPVPIDTYEEFLRLARLSLGGSLLGPMAHELNNVVQGLASAEYIFRDCFDNNEPIELEDVDQLADAVSRLRLMGAGVQGFARIGPSDAESLHLPDVFTRAAALLRSVGHLGLVEFEMDVPDSLPRMHWRLDELDFVVLALLANALDACMGGQGERRLVVRARATESAIELTLWNSGIELDWQSHPLPGQSGKDTNRHLGMGLSVAIAIVATRGGQFVPQIGAGTGLQLTLPLQARAAGA